MRKPAVPALNVIGFVCERSLVMARLEYTLISLDREKHSVFLVIFVVKNFDSVLPEGNIPNV